MSYSRCQARVSCGPSSTCCSKRSAGFPRRSSSLLHSKTKHWSRQSSQELVLYWLMASSLTWPWLVRGWRYKTEPLMDFIVHYAQSEGGSRPPLPSRRSYSCGHLDLCSSFPGAGLAWTTSSPPQRRGGSGVRMTKKAMPCQQRATSCNCAPNFVRGQMPTLPCASGDAPHVAYSARQALQCEVQVLPLHFLSASLDVHLLQSMDRLRGSS